MQKVLCRNAEGGQPCPGEQRSQDHFALGSVAVVVGTRGGEPATLAMHCVPAAAMQKLVS